MIKSPSKIVVQRAEDCVLVSFSGGEEKHSYRLRLDACEELAQALKEFCRTKLSKEDTITIH